VKHFQIIVVGGLCASLLSNYILITKLDAMDNNINNISIRSSALLTPRLAILIVPLIKLKKNKVG